MIGSAGPIGAESCPTWQSWRRQAFRMRRSARACGCRGMELRMPTSRTGASAPSVPWTRYLEGLWSGFRAGWVMIVVAIVLGARRIGWPWAAVFVFVVLGTAIGGLFIAMDMSRTLMMISPVLLLGVWLWESWRPAALRFVLPAVVAANLVLPAAHVMWHRYDRYLVAADRTSRMAKSTGFLSRGKIDRRSRTVLYALDARPRGARSLTKPFPWPPFTLMPSSSARRYECRQGIIAAAEPDLEIALELDGENPTGLFLRGVIRGSRQQTALAADDFRKALAHAPADWPARQDAEQFLQAATSDIEPATIRPVP